MIRLFIGIFIYLILYLIYGIQWGLEWLLNKVDPAFKRLLEITAEEDKKENRG